MTTPKFTPGPYHRDDELVLDSSDYVLAVVYCNENQEGNTQLFTAAPDLYTALEAMLSCAEAGDMDSMANASIAAKAALAKARGMKGGE